MNAASGSPITSAKRDQQHRRLPAGLFLPPARPEPAKTIAATVPASNAISTAPNPSLKIGCGRNRPRLLRKAPPRNDDAVADVGQRLEHGVVPEQQLQQQREISDGLDIAAGSFRQQPVARQPRYSDDKAEDRRKDDAEPGDQQRIEQPDPERAAIGRAARRILDQRLADIEAGGVVPESESGRDVRAREIFDRVAGCAIDQKGDHRAQGDLIGNAPDLGVVVKYDTRGARLRRQVTRHFPLVGLRRRNSSRRTAARRRARGHLSILAVSGSAARTGCRPWSTIYSGRARS